MKTVKLQNGIELVRFRDRPDWFQLPNKSLKICGCEGCYFETSDTLCVVEEKKFPSKRMTKKTCSCDKPPYLFETYDAYGCFCIPKDYYERHKPK